MDSRHVDFALEVADVDVDHPEIDYYVVGCPKLGWVWYDRSVEFHRILMSPT